MSTESFLCFIRTYEEMRPNDTPTSIMTGLPCPKTFHVKEKQLACKLWEKIREVVSTHEFFGLSIDGGIDTIKPQHLVISVLYVGMESFVLTPVYHQRKKAFNGVEMASHLVTMLRGGLGDTVQKLRYLMVDGCPVNHVTRAATETRLKEIYDRYQAVGTLDYTNLSQRVRANIPCVLELSCFGHLLNLVARDSLAHYRDRPSISFSECSPDLWLSWKLLLTRGRLLGCVNSLLPNKNNSIPLFGADDLFLSHFYLCFSLAEYYRCSTRTDATRTGAEDWMRNHDLFFPPICPSHGMHFMSDVPGKPNLSMCGHREPGKVNRLKVCKWSRQGCRLKVCKWSPFISPRTQLTPGQFLLVLADIANNMCTGQITRNRGLDRKVVQDLLHTLADAALRNETMFHYEFSRVQVDETFIGKRKYNRDRRQRKRGWWFATVTESRGTGKTGRTHWKLVKRRDTPTLHGFIIPHLTSARSVVVSDCWGAYNGLDKVCRHYSVNHSKEFVNEKGYHTNGAGSVHNTIKYSVRLQHYNVYWGNNVGIATKRRAPVCKVWGYP